MKRIRFTQSTSVVLPFPEEIWRAIFQIVSQEDSTWTNILSSCKYFNRLGEEIFFDKLTAPNENVDYEWEERENLKTLFSGKFSFQLH